MIRQLKWTLMLHLLLSNSVIAQENGIEFFETKIRPVLVNECYQCHSQNREIKGGLRLDWKGGWQKGGDGGPVIIPGRTDQSRLLSAIRQKEGDLTMPPKKKLRASEIKDFEQWIAMGAPDPRDSNETSEEQLHHDIEAARQFWAFQPPTKPARPKIKQVDWPMAELDHQVLAKLEASGISPVSDSDDSTLVRRLYLDLTGLPPTPDEIATFRENAGIDRAKAVNETVDKLLSRPAFGERWGRHWLDVARFSESTGGGRTLLLKEAWRYRDYVVSAFNADKPYNEFVREQIAGDLIEGGNFEQRKGRLIATAFLLLGPTNYELQDKTVLEMDIVDEQLDTMGKAFLGLTLGCARCHDHKFDPISTEDYYGLAGILKSSKSVIHNNVSTWNTRTLPLPPHEAAKAEKRALKVAALSQEIMKLKTQFGLSAVGLEPVASESLPGVIIDNLQATLSGSWSKSSSVKNYVNSEYLYTAPGNGEKKVTFSAALPKNEKYEARLSFAPHSNRSSNTLITVRHKNGQETRRVNQKKTPEIDGYFSSLGIFEFSKDEKAVIEVSNAGANGVVVADAVQFLPVSETILAKKEDKQNPLAIEVEEAKATIAKNEQQLKILEKSATSGQRVIAIEEGESPGDIHIAVRGNANDLGSKTPRSFIRVMHRNPVPELSPHTSGRLELANWLASPSNPLTARVFVNRVWRHLFGQSIVKSVDNFGRMGQLPTNQALLDLLAVQFIESGWSVKSLIGEIVKSRTYQLSSDPGKDNQRLIDQENDRLWRQNHRRLEAEAIRDSILAISGELDQRIGGDTIKQGTTIEYGYKFEDTRRSLYTPVFRNTPLEILAVFDAADPNIVVGARETSSVPTQALYLMNSPFVRKHAALAAKRHLASWPHKSDERVNQAYLLALGRDASLRERKIVEDHTQANPDELTAWTQVFHSLFASLEFRHLN
jgi:hypothetical protein